MSLYRVLKPLDTGHMPGQLVEGSRFKRLDVLVKKGVLSPVSYPPLTEIPGWQLRAEKLARVGIITVGDFLGADDERLRRLFGYKTLRMIAKWKREIKDWLIVEPEKKR